MQNHSKQSSVANILRFYELSNRLKNVIRTGWKSWRVKRERLESIAEHIFGTQMLAISIWSEFHYDVDIQKVIFMLAVHELEEIIIGDYIPYDNVTEAEKMQQGHRAVCNLLDGFLKQTEIEAIVFEFDARKTPEAKFAYQCDKLEADLQCCLYGSEGCVDLPSQADNPLLQDKLIQKYYQQDLPWSKIWCSVSRERIDYDENFTAILLSASGLDTN